MNEKILDVKFQQLSQGKKCHFCNKPAKASHHIYGRANKYLRWLHINALPVCIEHHSDIHDRGLEFDIPAELTALRNISLKQYLVENGQTKQDFMKEKYLELNYILKEEY